MSDLSQEAYKIINALRGVEVDKVTNLVIDQNLRIAALEEQNKKLVEALENSTQCLEAWKLYHSKFFDKADESAVTTARALLSEVS